MISGPATTLPVIESTTTMTEMKPSSRRMRRSLSSVSSASPTRGAVDVDVAARHGADDRGHAVDEVDDHAVLGDDDAVARDARWRSASSALATRWRHSPCTGMTLRGLTML